MLGDVSFLGANDEFNIEKSNPEKDVSIRSQFNSCVSK